MILVLLKESGLIVFVRKRNVMNIILAFRCLYLYFFFFYLNSY